MGELVLTGLDGSNPLGFLTGLGVLGALDRVPAATEAPTLRWEVGLVPHAVVDAGRPFADVVAAVLADRDAWRAEVPLSLTSHDDVKLEPGQLRSAMEASVAGPGRRRGADLIAALVAEGALAGNGREAKPTALHFTAGQQRFLRMARELCAGVTAVHVEEALLGPWRYESTLPVLGWDAGGERLYALRSSDPAKDKKRGVPGADWLAFVGLTFLPVASGAGGQLVTTCCTGSWKRGRFEWPLWSVPAGAATVRSVLAGGLGESLRHRGVHVAYRARIQRSEQGGYGSFSPPEVLW